MLKRPLEASLGEFIGNCGEITVISVELWGGALEASVGTLKRTVEVCRCGCGKLCGVAVVSFVGVLV
jgi:hypothetical protein